ncbi:hypothetical protein ABZ611_26165 [Streptomyces sp. NPDC007861]
MFPREMEHCAQDAAFEVMDMTDGAGARLTGPTAYTVARYTRR